MLGVILATALAQVPVLLPADEPIAPWRSAFELADLRPAETPTQAVVRVRVVGSSWQIVVRAPDGRERTEAMTKPTTAVAREEFALVAQSLCRDLGLAPTPAAPRYAAPDPPPPPPSRAPPLPLPPPPPPPLPEPAPERAPEPAPRSPSPPSQPVLAVSPPGEGPAGSPARGLAADTAPAPRPDPQKPTPSTDTAPADPAVPAAGDPPPDADEEPAASSDPTIEPVAIVQLDPEPPPRTRAVGMPGLRVGTGLSWRPGTVPAFTVELGVVPVKSRSFELEIGGHLSTMARIDWQFDRGVTVAGLHVLGGLVVGPFTVQLGPDLGLYMFRQQFNPMGSIFVPRLRVGPQLTPFRWRSLGAAVRAHAVVDLTRTELVDETGRKADLLPVGLMIDVLFDFSGFGDPKRVLPTPTRR